MKPRTDPRQNLWRAIRFRSICYLLVGLIGLMLLVGRYLSATITLAATAVVLISFEYGLSLAMKNKLSN